MPGYPWTAAEDDLLHLYWRCGLSDGDIGAKLGRTVHGVHRRRKRVLGLAANARQRRRRERAREVSRRTGNWRLAAAARQARTRAREGRVLLALQLVGPATARDLALLLGLCENTLRHLLVRLAAAGRVAVAGRTAPGKGRRRAVLWGVVS
jgi:hypothetical protein